MPSAKISKQATDLGPGVKFLLNDGRIETGPRAGHFERDDYSPLFQSLFIDPKGVVDVNACGPSESAFFLPPPKQDGDRYGSLFTTALTEE